MKTKFVLASFIAALSGFAGLANTANAGTDFRINLNLGLPRPPVLIVPSHTPVIVTHEYRSAPRGYWKEIVVKTWVPARWVVTHGRHGRDIRTMEPGYFSYRTDRVWVDGRGDFGRGDYGRSDEYYTRR
jgi:hypothetical protein